MRRWSGGGARGPASDRCGRDLSFPVMLFYSSVCWVHEVFPSGQRQREGREREREKAMKERCREDPEQEIQGLLLGAMLGDDSSTPLLPLPRSVGGSFSRGILFCSSPLTLSNILLNVPALGPQTSPPLFSDIAIGHRSTAPTSVVIPCWDQLVSGQR